jgi:cytochrome P450
MVHDWVNHRNYVSDPNEPEQSHAIELPEAHPANRLYHQRWMAFGRTMPDPTRRRDEQHLPPTALNTVTSWWDGSQVYGSDPETARKLRSGEDGKLKLSENGLLPLDGEQELAGNTNNWWVGLSLLHTVFVREHNAICDELKQHYPDWDDARLYNVARLVNAAVMAKIHTLEWTPAVLPNATLKMALESNWYGLIESRLHRKKRRVRRRIKIRDSVLGGLVGNPIKKDGVPYGLSEEFTEVYRLHELLPDEIEVRTLEDSAHVTPIPLASTRHKNARSLLEQHELVNLLYSFGVQHPGQIVLNNYPRTLQQISIPGQAMFDVGAADILRARERGVPRYNDFRRGLGLTPISRFEDLTADHQQLRKLKAIYQNDVNRIDLHIGTRAETTRPRGFGFGETLFQVFILNASRRLQADRFFTDDYDAETYTQTGLDWVDAATLKSVLLRHYPELYRTGLANVNNAFEPWDFGTLDPKRHPLEYIDRPGPLGKLLEGLESAVDRAGTHLRNAQVLGNELALELASIRQAASTVSRKNADLPGPLPNGSFGLPIVGETRAFLKDNGKFLQERFDRHGPIFKTHVAGHPTACLGGKEAYEKFLTSPALVRQMGSPVHVRMLFNPRSLSFRDGADHTRMRAQLLDGFSPENLEPCLPSLNALITRYLARWESRHELEWVPELLTFSFACIDSVILGNDASRENTRLTRAFDALTSGVLASPFSLRFARAYRARFILEEHVAAVVEARRRQPRADVVSRLLAGGRHGRLTDAELRMELVHFFLAAAPLHSALSYHLLLLGQHPAVMQHARLEAEQLTPTDLLRIGRIHELTYIAQVCRESRRCARLVPNTFFAKVVAPFEHGGFHVPAGWRAVGLIGATQHEPSVGRPERFDPERFAEAVPPAYVAHGGKRDPHACTGEPFADLVLTLLTARLLKQFTWSVPQQDLTPRLGKVAPTPASGLRVNFRKYAPLRAER